MKFGKSQYGFYCVISYVNCLPPNTESLGIECDLCLTWTQRGSPQAPSSSYIGVYQDKATYWTFLTYFSKGWN